MKVRKNFFPLADGVASTEVYDATSLTQPDMSLTVQQIIDQFAFIGDVPLGMMTVKEPPINFDEELFGSVDVERLDIAELEELSRQMMAKADYLRSLPPSPAAPDPAATVPNGEADAQPAE